MYLETFESMLYLKTPGQHVLHETVTILDFCKIKVVNGFSWDMITLGNNKVSKLKLYKNEIEEEKTYLMKAFSQNCLCTTPM